MSSLKKNLQPVEANPLKKFLKATQTFTKDIEEEDPLMKALEKENNSNIKKNRNLKLIKELLDKDIKSLALMQALEKQNLVDKYPSEADRKIYYYRYRLYWPLDKSNIKDGTVFNYKIIDFTYKGDLFIFRFPLRLLPSGTWKLDHFDNIEQPDGTITGQDTLPKALLIFAKTGNISDSSVLKVFKEYKIIKDDDLSNLDFCIKGHHIAVIYSQEGRRKESGTTEPTKEVTPESTKDVYDEPSESFDVDVDNPKSLAAYNAINKDLRKKIVETKNLNFNTLGVVGQSVNGDLDKYKKKYSNQKSTDSFTIFNINDFSIPGVDNIIPKSDLLLSYPYNDKKVRYPNSPVLPIITYNKDTKKLDLTLTLDYNDIAVQKKIGIKGSEKRRVLVIYDIMKQNAKQYGLYEADR